MLFANFAESIAEGRGKAQAATLRQSKKDSKARRIKSDGSEEMLNSSELKIGDIVLVKAGELIPNDGEIIEGAARQKTPNEIALNTLLIALSLSFLVVVVSLYPFIQFLGVSLPISWLVALLVCLIPTTIGGGAFISYRNSRYGQGNAF